MSLEKVMFQERGAQTATIFSWAFKGKTTQEGIFSTLNDLFKTMCYWKTLWAIGVAFYLELKKKKKKNSESGYKDSKAGNSLPLSLRKAESDTKEQGSQKWLIL